MKLKEIYNYLDTVSAFEIQESWDNSGLIVGDLESEISTIALSIDIDEKMIESLDEGTLIISHHPLIFSGLKDLDYAKYPSNLLHKMIKKNISNVAMHTNFDLTHLNEYIATEILGQKILKQEGFVIYFEVDEEFEPFAKKIASTFGFTQAKCVKSKQRVKRVALTTGSGCSLIKNIDADCYLTGDIKYHDAMEAKSLNLSLIEIGHYESEHFFAQILEKHLKNLGLKVIIASSENPFTYI